MYLIFVNSALLLVVLEIDNDTDNTELEQHDHALHELVGQHTPSHGAQRATGLAHRLVSLGEIVARVLELAALPLQIQRDLRIAC